MKHILKTKLFIPQYAKSNLSRKRLVEKIDLGMNNKVTLIAAPAGFGKTTLAAEWARQTRLPVCWYSLDPSDDDLFIFFSYVVAALQGEDETIGDLTLTLEQQPKQGAIPNILTPIINDVAKIKSEIVLVLDDFHTITNNMIIRALCYLIEYCPPNLHLIIISRTEPSLLLSRLRAGKQICELQANDLRFTSKEIGAFLNEIKKLDLSIQDITCLETRTEGWIAGMQLAKSWVQNQLDVCTAIQEISGDIDFFSEYFLDEVFVDLDEETIQFLLRTSVLEELNSDVCNTVAGINNSQDILQELCKSNLFISPLFPPHRGYQTHPLFSEFLQSQLRKRTPEQISALNQKASNWYLKENLALAATRHAILARDYQLVDQGLQLMVNKYWSQSNMQVVHEWFSKVPDAEIRKDVNLCLHKAWISHLVSDIDNRDLFLEIANQLIDEDSIDPECIKFRGIKLAIEAIVDSSYPGRHKLAAKNISAAWEILPQDEIHWRLCLMMSRGKVLFSLNQIDQAEESFSETIKTSKILDDPSSVLLAKTYLAQCHIAQGALNQAQTCCFNALKTIPDTHPFVIDFNIRLCLIHYERRQLKAAAQNLEVVFSHDSLGTREKVEGLIFSIRVEMGHERFAEAAELLALASRLLAENPDLQSTLLINLKSTIVALNVLLFLKQNNLVQAKKLLNKLDLDTEKVKYINEIQALVQVEYLLACNQKSSALELINHIISDAEEAGNRGLWIKGMILRARFHRKIEEMPKALDEISSALRLAEDEGFKQFFFEQRIHINPLLKEALRRDDVPRQFLQGLISELFPPPLKENEQGQAEISILTLREIEVLQLVAAGNSNKEISATLVISIHTTKNHIKNILRKLNVYSRVEAVARAKALSILK